MRAEERSRDERQPSTQQVGAALPADRRRPAHAAEKTSPRGAISAITALRERRRRQDEAVVWRPLQDTSSQATPVLRSFDRLNLAERSRRYCAGVKPVRRLNVTVNR